MSSGWGIQSGSGSAGAEVKRHAVAGDGIVEAGERLGICRFGGREEPEAIPARAGGLDEIDEAFPDREGAPFDEAGDGFFLAS